MCICDGWFERLNSIFMEYMMYSCTMPYGFVCIISVFFLLTNHIERQCCFPVTIATRVMLACTGTHGPVHIPGQRISREAQGRSLSTDRTFQIATLEMGIVCIRVASFHTTRDITSVALRQGYVVGGVHSLVGLGLTFDCYLRWEGWGF